MVQAQNDHVLLSDETKDILFDRLTFRAFNITWNVSDFNHVEKWIQRSGLNQKRSGKAIIKEKHFKNFKLSYSYQKRAKRWSFYFNFDPKFDIKLCYGLIERFLVKSVHLELKNHKIEYLGSSESTIDLKNFDPEFIENISKAIDRLRKKDEFYKSAIVDGRFIKLYLKEKKIRLETKLGSSGSPTKTAWETLESILLEKESLLDEETKEQLDLQEIIKLLLEIKGSLDTHHFLMMELNTIELRKIVGIKHEHRKFQSDLLTTLNEIRLQTDFLHANLLVLTKNQELTFLNLQQYQDKIADFFEFNLQVNEKHFETLSNKNGARFEELTTAFNRDHAQKLQMMNEFNSLLKKRGSNGPLGINEIHGFTTFISCLTNIKQLLIKIGSYLMRILRIGIYRIKQSSSRTYKIKNKESKKNE